MHFEGIRRRFPLLFLLGLAILVVGCPKKPPPPAKPAEPVKPREAPVARPPAPPPPPAPAPPPKPVAKAEDEKARKAREFQEALRVFESELVHFDFDRSEIKEEFKPVLARKAEFLKRYPKVRVQIEGHCDERGSIQYNLALGDRRANSAKTFLAAMGIDGGRLSTISYGEERPLEEGQNEEAWAKNRRAKFVVVSR